MSYQTACCKILDELRAACGAVNPDEVEKLAQAVMQADKVFLMGVGRVLISLMAFCKRLNHLGIPACCVGELNEPAATDADLLIVGSGSGETACPLQIARIAKNHGAKVAHIGSNPNSSMRQYADLFVRIPVKTKLNLPGELPSDQIMSSLFEQSLYVLCDSVCLMIAEAKQLSLPELWRFHANLE